MFAKLFKKTEKKEEKETKKINIHNWYYDRYNIVVVQRNLLSIIILACLVTMFSGLLYINQISQYKAIEPFIVEIEEKTGIPTVVDQMSLKEYKADEVIQEYFIYTYIRARESYDYRTYSYDYHTVVRLLSDTGVYSGFRRQVSSRNEDSPVNVYARHTGLVSTIKSIQDIEGAKQIRVLIQHIKRNVIIKEEHKIIYLKYEFANLNITLEERLVNPLGFRVTEYRVNEDFVKE